ncbi:MAG: hypothetical protein NC177_03115 [Ruminococcus flavefaciens]|nr:hypothetical protein [Ruminococcus flavefaciens]
MKKKILFAYKTKSSMCYNVLDYCEYKGFLFTVYTDGTAEYSLYVMPDIPKITKTFIISTETLKAIVSIIEKYMDILLAVPLSLDNSILDGDYNEFTFYNKKIYASNINTYDIEEIKKSDYEYYKNYYINMVHENNVMKVFSKICGIIRKNNNIDMDLYKFEVIKSNVLFGHSYMILFSDSGYSIDIYNDCTAVYSDYICYNKPYNSVSFKIAPKTLQKIRDILDKKRETVYSFDSHIKGNCEDGYSNVFIFNDKKTEITRISSLLDRKYSWFEETHIEQSENILQIFNDICSILKKYNYADMDLYKCRLLKNNK